MINKKLIHFNSKDNFMSVNGVNGDTTTPSSGSEETGNAEYGNLKGTSIVFIKDSKEIWTHGTTYSYVNWDVLKPALVGDIAYWDGSKVKTISQENWDSSLGTAVGVVVVPTGFAPDGKARMLSLRWPSSTSTGSTNASYVRWSNVNVDTSLTNHTRVPTTDNTGSTTTGAANYAYLPSNKFTGTVSYVDPLTQYSGTSRTMIPSPYLGDEPNPAYYAEMSGYNNALSDFDGKGNTDVLVGLGTGYTAANAARKYKAAGAEKIEWYLPSIGELGYMMVRFNKIQAALAKVNSPQLGSNYYYWSSSEYSSNSAYVMNAGSGYVSSYSKNTNYFARPFAIID